MSFLIRSRALFSEDSAYAGPLEAWRDAEATVRARWHEFLAADGEARRFAFAAYVAALDLEAAAADELAALVPVDRAA
jgi:hypothetical protein